MYKPFGKAKIYWYFMKGVKNAWNGLLLLIQKTNKANTNPTYLEKKKTKYKSNLGIYNLPKKMYKPFGAKQNLAALLDERGKILEVTKEIQ
jgi:hypothetical protein